MKKPENFEEYLKDYPAEVQKLLKQVRQTVLANAPQATELISYGMPYYKLNGRLLYFAAHTKHLGFYPLRSAITHFKKEIAGYKSAAGSVQFPFDEPLPLKLIARMVKFRVKENLMKGKK